MRLRISAIASILGVAALMAACDLMETDKPAAMSPEAAARAQAAAVDSATRYKDSLAAYRKADSLAWVAKKAAWKTDSASFIAAAKVASDKWKIDSIKAVAKFKVDSIKARKQFVKDSGAWVKDSLAGIKTLSKDSAAWEKKKAADSLLYEKAVAAMAKKYTADSIALEKVHVKYLTLLGKDSLAITTLTEAIAADTVEKTKAVKQAKLDKANAKLTADQTKYDEAVAKALAKITADSTKGEETKTAKLTKRADDSTAAAAKYTKDSTTVAGKVSTRVTTWATNYTKDSTKLATDTADYWLKYRTKVAAKITKDSLDSLKKRTDSIAIVSADSALMVRKAVPAFSVASGTYAATQTLTLTTAFPSGKIYYTLDGTTPDSTKTAYSSALTLAIGKTVKAIAYDSGKTAATRVFGQTYIIDTAATPTIAAPYADTADSIAVILTSSDTSDMYYTFNGVAPTTTVSSTNIKISPANGKDTITIGKSDTIKVLAVKTGRLNSPVVTQGFLLTLPAPVFSHPDTVATDSLWVRFADSAKGVTIRYTLTGVAPTAATATTIASGDSLKIATTTVIKALATRAGAITSAVATVTDTIQVAAVTNNLAAGAIDTATDAATLATTTSGAAIYYTLNGSDPTSTASSTNFLYSAPVRIHAAGTLKAVAFKTGMKATAVKSAVYTVATP